MQRRKQIIGNIAFRIICLMFSLCASAAAQVDTDSDGLTDAVETNTGTYVSPTNTGTNPNLSDTDGDGAGDWYEVKASFTNPLQASSAPRVPYPLPDPNTSTGATNKRVKVYIMSGQSNMVGMGTMSGTIDKSLETFARTGKKFPDLVNASNGWTTRKDVRYRGVISDITNAELSPSNLGDKFGPELGFGYVMGWYHDEPVLLLKSSIGNRSLGWDILPKGTPGWTYNGKGYSAYGKPTPVAQGDWYAGKEFDRFFMHESEWAHPDTAATNVVDVLDGFATQYPAWAAQGFEIAGFVWWQGDKDRYDIGHATRYEDNLVKLINGLRSYYTNRYPGKVVSNAPFVLATLGQTATNSTDPEDKPILDAMLAVDGKTGKYPQFAGNVKTVYSHPLSEGGASNDHYQERAGTYMLVGDALGRAMVDLLSTGSPASQLTALTISSGMLSPAFVGTTFAYSATVSTPSITVTPTLAGGTITVNGSPVASGAASAAIPLSIGANTITVASTVSGSTSTYTLTITRTQNTYTWAINQAGPSSWTTAANWTPNTGFPTSIDDLAALTNNITADNQISLAGPITLGGLNIGDSAGDNAFALSAGHSLNFDVMTGSATLARLATGTGADTISTAVILADPLTVSVSNNTGSLSINGAISQTGGTQAITKTGNGTLILNGSNSYTGVTRISAGTLQANTLANGGSNSAIGASSTASTNLILNGGTLKYSGPAVSTNRLFSLQASSTIDASGTGAVNFTNASAMGFSGSTADKTLTLSGDNTGANTLTAIIGNNTGVTSLTKSGTGTWLLSGANTYTGATIINGGTLRLANTAAVQNSSQVNINSGTNAGTLELATNTAFATFPIIGGGSTAQATIVSNRATAGAGLTHVLGEANFGTNTYHFSSGANVTSGTGGISFPNVNLSGGGDGTTIFNPTNANLIIVGGVTIPSGGTAKTLNLGGASNGNTVGGAITNGIGTLSLTKSNTSTWTLSGLSATAANNYGGATIIDNGTLRITTTNPSLTGNLTFGSVAGGMNVGNLDLSTASATFAGAFLVRTNSTNASAITIGSGRTLQLNGAFTVGYNTTALPHSTTGLDVTGAGTLSIGTSGTPTNANMQIGNGQTTSISNTATMDLGGLSNFYSNLGTGTFRVGSPTNGGGVSAGGSTVILAPNSTILADKLLLASPDSSTSTQSLKLGSGTNVLNVNTIHVSGTGNLFSNNNGRSTGSLTFNGATGSLTLRGLAGGTTRSDLNVAWTNMNTANTPTGTFDTNGHTADLLLGTMTIGRRTNTGSIAAGIFNFNQGQLDANDLIIALAEAGAGSTGTVSLGGGTSTFRNTSNPIRLGENTTSGGTATGTLNISGGSVTVSASGGNSIRLGNASTASGTANGTLNLTGGNLTVAGDIIRGATVGTSNATLSLGGGILDMTGKNITSLTSITYSNGTLKNLGTINTGMTLAGTGSRVFDQGSGISGSIQGAIAGAGLGLTKQGAGSLTLTGPNTYTGDTTVTVGSLTLADDAQLMFVIGSTSGTNNRITGTGTVILNGDFNIDTTLTDASSLTSGSWTIVNASTLTENFGSSFTITGAGWSEAANVWTRTVGSKKYTFTEATGILALSSAASYASWIDGIFPGETNPSIIGAAADPDQDGIENGVELLIGGNPKLGMDTALLPTIEQVTADPDGDTTFADYLLFTYRRSDLSATAGITSACETNTSLAAPWTPADGAPGVVIQVDDNFTFTPPAATPADRVRVYVPRGSNSTQFGRLKVLVP